MNDEWIIDDVKVLIHKDLNIQKRHIWIVSHRVV